MTDLDWHVIDGQKLLDVMRRCEAGESADLVFAELWANADCEPPPRSLPTEGESE